MATGAQKQLITLYEKAQKKLIDIITKKAHGGSAAAYERKILRQVTKELQALRKATPELVQQLVLEGWETGLDSAVDDILKQSVPTPPAYNLFSRLNIEQINLVVQNTVDELTKAVNIVGRRFQDELREAGLKATASKLTTGGTVRDMHKELVKRLMGIDQTKQANGRLGVKYRNGKIVSIDTYSKMVARTTTAEAQNKSKVVQGTEWGYDLVRITTHAPTCEVCAKYQDKVYALTKEAANGKYKGVNGEPLYFPYLYETALWHGYETIHPNCRHRLSLLAARAYTKKELTEFSKKSMPPFTDTRSDKERKDYAKTQAINRSRNADLREWNKYKAFLPEETPKTFSAFRSMKRANSMRYQDLKKDMKFIYQQIASKESK